MSEEPSSSTFRVVTDYEAYEVKWDGDWVKDIVALSTETPVSETLHVFVANCNAACRLLRYPKQAVDLSANLAEGILAGHSPTSEIIEGVLSIIQSNAKACGISASALDVCRLTEAIRQQAEETMSKMESYRYEAVTDLKQALWDEQFKHEHGMIGHGIAAMVNLSFVQLFFAYESLLIQFSRISRGIAGVGRDQIQHALDSWLSTVDRKRVWCGEIQECSKIRNAIAHRSGMLLAPDPEVTEYAFVEGGKYFIHPVGFLRLYSLVKERSKIAVELACNRYDG